VRGRRCGLRERVFSVEAITVGPFVGHRTGGWIPTKRRQEVTAAVAASVGAARLGAGLHCASVRQLRDDSEHELGHRPWLVLTSSSERWTGRQAMAIGEGILRPWRVRFFFFVIAVS
jgi:hypothetical protein